MKEKKSAWTLFWDMHSGGGQKLDWEKIYIEAPQKEAESIFYARFGRNPNRVTCSCCGEDYSMSESETLAEASAYHRHCAYAYFDKDGNEVKKTEYHSSGIAGMGYYTKRKGLTERYVERPGGSKYMTLEEYLRDPKRNLRNLISSRIRQC